MLLSSTAYSDASYCLRRYAYRWVEKLVTKPARMGVALRRGIWIHKCLEEYHKGRDWELALGAMEDWAVSRGVDADKATEIARECQRIMLGYIAYWAHRPQWKTLLTEYSVVFGSEEKSGIRATIDLGVATSDGQWLVEHKSTAEIPPAAWRSVDPQTALQYWLCHNTDVRLPDGTRFLPKGIIFNYLVTSEPGKPRWKKSGELYANVGVTTSLAWQDALRREGYQPDAFPDDRARLVNDDLFYKRFPVERPIANVRSTMRDIIATLEDLNKASERGWYRRSFHVLTCRRFCPYSELCVHEYVLGKESPTLRDELFVIDDGNRGEGR